MIDFDKPIRGRFSKDPFKIIWQSKTHVLLLNEKTDIPHCHWKIDVEGYFENVPEEPKHLYVAIPNIKILAARVSSDPVSLSGSGAVLLLLTEAEARELNRNDPAFVYSRVTT